MIFERNSSLGYHHMFSGVPSHVLWGTITWSAENKTYKLKRSVDKSKLDVPIAGAFYK